MIKDQYRHNNISEPIRSHSFQSRTHNQLRFIVVSQKITLKTNLNLIPKEDLNKPELQSYKKEFNQSIQDKAHNQRQLATPNQKQMNKISRSAKIDKGEHKDRHPHLFIPRKNPLQKTISSIKNQPVSKIKNKCQTKICTIRSKTLKKRRKKNCIKNVEEFLSITNIQTQCSKTHKLPGITATAVCILQNNKIIYSHRGDNVQQIASITKVMTCLVVLYLSRKFGINIYEELVKVSKRASEIHGTSALLKFGDYLTIDSLLYGLMLPSGNDAAVALAQYFHKLIYQKQKAKQKAQKESDNFRKVDIGPISSYSQGLHLFLQEMNKMADYLKLKNTHFSNPHGLPDHHNVSTADDVAQLSYYAVKIPEFQTYVSQKWQKANIYNRQKQLIRECQWENTQKLLFTHKLCLGIKTGTTMTAGYTLSSYFKKEELEVIIVVLQTQKKQDRFSETQKLYQLCQQHYFQ